MAIPISLNGTPPACTPNANGRPDNIFEPCQLHMNQYVTTTGQSVQFESARVGKRGNNYHARQAFRDT